MAHLYLSIVHRFKRDLKAGWYLCEHHRGTCTAVRSVDIYANGNCSISWRAIYKHLDLEVSLDMSRGLGDGYSGVGRWSQQNILRCRSAVKIFPSDRAEWRKARIFNCFCSVPPRLPDMVRPAGR